MKVIQISENAVKLYPSLDEWHGSDVDLVEDFEDIKGLLKPEIVDSISEILLKAHSDVMNTIFNGVNPELVSEKGEAVGAIIDQTLLDGLWDDLSYLMAKLSYLANLTIEREQPDLIEVVEKLEELEDNKNTIEFLKPPVNGYEFSICLHFNHVDDLVAIDDTHGDLTTLTRIAKIQDAAASAIRDYEDKGN